MVYIFLAHKHTHTRTEPLASGRSPQKIMESMKKEELILSGETAALCECDCRLGGREPGGASAPLDCGPK